MGQRQRASEAAAEHLSKKVLRVYLGHLTMQNRVPVLKRPSGAVSGHSVSMTPQSLFVPPPMPPMVRSLITRHRRHSNALIFVLTHSQPKLNQPNPIIKPSRPSSFVPMSLFPSVFSPRAHPHIWLSRTCRSTVDSRRMTAALVQQNQVSYRFYLT